MNCSIEILINNGITDYYYDYIWKYIYVYDGNIFMYMMEI
jgi:hypothetical protein